MANKLMYIPNDDQNYPDRRLQLLVVTFGHSTELTKWLKRLDTQPIKIQ